MSRGWDLGGARGYDGSSWRLICADPPGPGGAIRPNVFCGLCPWDATPPAINLGVANYSIEAWFSWKLHANVLGDMLWRIGFLAPFGVFLQQMGCISLQNLVWMANAGYDDVPGVAPIPIETPLVDVPGGWVHLAVNFNRAGNMTLYVNGALLGTIAINANNQGSVRFYALTGYWNDRAGYDADWADWTGWSQCRGVMGPIAAHRRLLTLPEIQESIRAKRVNNFGAANSWLVWDWRLIERLDGAPVTWDTDETHVLHAIRAGLQERGLAAPTGAAGTIRIPDLSGSGNHWVLPTVATYGATTATKAVIAFLSDPFWST